MEAVLRPGSSPEIPSRTWLSSRSIPVRPTARRCRLATASDYGWRRPSSPSANALRLRAYRDRRLVSAVGPQRQSEQGSLYRQLIQTDAAINPGNPAARCSTSTAIWSAVNVAIRAGAQASASPSPVDSMIRVAANLIATRSARRLGHGLVIHDDAHIDPATGVCTADSHGRELARHCSHWTAEGRSPRPRWRSAHPHEPGRGTCP